MKLTKTRLFDCQKKRQPVLLCESCKKTTGKLQWLSTILMGVLKWFEGSDGFPNISQTQNPRIIFPTSHCSERFTPPSKDPFTSVAHWSLTTVGCWWGGVIIFDWWYIKHNETAIHWIMTVVHLSQYPQSTQWFLDAWSFMCPSTCPGTFCMQSMWSATELLPFPEKCVLAWILGVRETLV